MGNCADVDRVILYARLRAIECEGKLQPYRAAVVDLSPPFPAVLFERAVTA